MAGGYFLVCSLLEKCRIFWKKRQIFRADMAGLGKYHTGGYGRIGVYRVKDEVLAITPSELLWVCHSRLGSVRAVRSL